MLKFMLFGAGRIGKVHARHIARHPDAELRYVVDPNLEAANALAAPLGAGARVDAGAALAEVDAVLISTPTSTHVDLIEAAARAGKAVFCEKPIDLDIARVEACAATVRQCGVPFYLGFHMRFDPSYQDICRSIRDGVIGKVEQVIMIGRDRDPPPIEYIRQSGGLFRDAMIHAIDFLRWTLAEDPIRVFAFGECIIDPKIGEAGDFDSAMLMLSMPSGAICTISGGRRAVQGQEGGGARFFGSKGLLSVGTSYASDMEGYLAGGPLPKRGFTGFEDRFAAAYAAELDHFIAAVLAGEDPLTGLEDGRRSLLIADAATSSARQRQPVDLVY